MLRLLRFYLRHALRDMARNRRLTLFALFSVAVGVSTVVGLHTLSLMITDTLLNDIQAVNQGDIVLFPGWSGGPGGMMGNMDFGFLMGIDDEDTSGHTISAADTQSVYGWAAAHDIEVTKANTVNWVQASPIQDDGEAGVPRFTQLMFVEPAYYPPYDTITAEEPKGVPLDELLQAPTDIVLGRNLADQFGAEVGDQVRVGPAEQLFTVRGIVPITSQGGFRNILAVLFGFAYLDYDAMTSFGISTNPSQLYLKLPDPSQVDDLDHEARYLGHFSSSTTTELREAFEFATDALERVVLVLSLTALFIGGIGIINTMLVIVSRRTLEVAVLKTLGLKGRQITALFMVEALVLGVLGSALGCVIGILLGAFLSTGGLGEQIVGRPLMWSFRLDPLVLGTVMGVVITTVFGFLPTLAAGKVRPAAVLRPNDLPIPRAGKLRSLLAILAMVLILGFVIGQVVQPGALFDFEPYGSEAPASRVTTVNLLFGIGGTLVAMILLGLMVGLLWMLVWLIGRLPHFGSVNLKLSLRALRGHRTRNASTLLALIIGVASLSVITLVNGTVTKVLNQRLSEMIGGNVAVISFTTGSAANAANVLNNAEGVRGYTQFKVDTRFDLVAINGQIDLTNLAAGTNLTWDDINALENQLDEVWAVSMGGTPIYPELVAGDQMTPEHMDDPVVVIPGTPEVLAVGLKPGDVLTYRNYRNNATVDLTVLGIAEPGDPENGEVRMLGVVPYAPEPMLPVSEDDDAFQFRMAFADVEDGHTNHVLASLGGVLGNIVFDIGLIDSLVKRILEQMTILPRLASALSLAAGAVIIANTVSLATLERKREIGIMKALGLKGKRVLGLLLLENGIIGVTSGIIGVVIGAIPAILIGNELTQGIIDVTLPITSVIGLLLLALAIALGATLLTAYGASRQKPLTVLRYE